MMTNWQPNLEGFAGPRYLAIAEHLARDVSAGRLKPGERLPTHRDLAWNLKVTVGTVTRAYAEAERRGLISGEVGRGTYVRGRMVEALPPLPTDDEFLDLTRSFPYQDPSDRTIADVIAEIGNGPNPWPLLGYTNTLGLPAHRAAAASWIGRWGMAAAPNETAVTNGAQHALHVAFGTLARPGDTILAEQLTFYGLKSVAAFLSLRLHGVAIDEHGLIPEALDAACRQLMPKALYCIPTLQNPTNAIMPAGRRAEIAAICKRHGVIIVEDDIYGFLAERAPPPLSSLAPDHSVYVTSLSKCVAPGLRIGYLRANEALIERIGVSLRATTWMTTPLMAEIATRLISSGAALRIAVAQRAEAKARQAMAARSFAGAEFAAHPTGSNFWLKLPEPWRREDFAAQARRRGVGVAAAEIFAVGRAPVPHAVRISLLAARDRKQLERGLGILEELLRAAPEQAAPMV